MSSLSRHLAILSGFLLCAWAVCAWWFGYVTQLQYESPDSFFMFGSQFLQQWAARPGDLTLYATRFLRQFSHYTWLGTLVAATAATALGLVAHLVARRLRPEPSVLHTVLPAVALLVLHARGGDLAVGALLCYALFLGYLTLGSGPAGRAYTVAATVILYVIGGAFAWPFALWILAYESRGRQGRDNLGFRAAYLALTLCLPWVAYRWLYGISLSVALRHPIYPAGSALELCLGLYLVLLPLALARRWPWALQSRLGPGRALAATLSATAVAAAVLLGLSHDAGSAEVARYHRLYRARQWDSLLEMARSDPSPSGMSQFFTNFALAQKGQLLEQMFTYPQQYGTGGLVLSFSTSDEHLSRAMYASDLFFEMGHTNAAFRLAYNQRNLGRSYANL